MTLTLVRKLFEVLFLTSGLASAASAAELVHARDGSGVYGYKDTPKLPWCEYLVHDPDRPAPQRINPGPAPAPAAPPSDAIVLFNGKDLSKWQTIYGQTPPLVNACRPPGEWQSFDIVFTAPVFAAGKLAQPARVTLFHNGVLAHLDEEIHGEIGHRILPEYRQKISQGPLLLSGHGCPVRFRNIWVRPL